MGHTIIVIFSWNWQTWDTPAVVSLDSCLNSAATAYTIFSTTSLSSFMYVIGTLCCRPGCSVSVQFDQVSPPTWHCQLKSTFWICSARNIVAVGKNRHRCVPFCLFNPDYIILLLIIIMPPIESIISVCLAHHHYYVIMIMSRTDETDRLVRCAKQGGMPLLLVQLAMVVVNEFLSSGNLLAICDWVIDRQVYKLGDRWDGWCGSILWSWL